MAPATATDGAILDAAGDLLLEYGVNSISMDQVADRAGVTTAAVRRRWPSKELLATDALLNDWAPSEPDAADTGSLEGDLLAVIRPWARQLATKPYGRVLAALITRAQSDPRFAWEYRARFIQPRRALVRTVFDRAIERGEISEATDVETALDLLHGPFYLRVLQGHATLSDRFARQVVAYVVAAVAPPARP